MTDNPPKNTAEQRDAHKAAEEAWAEERKQPLWRVIVTGDDTGWVARPGVNLDADGVPQPWTAPHRADVTLRAPTEDAARARALAHNPACHTVESCEKVKEG